MFFYTFIGSYFTLLSFGTHHYMQCLFDQQIIYQINEIANSDKEKPKQRCLTPHPFYVSLCNQNFMEITILRGFQEAIGRNPGTGCCGCCWWVQTFCCCFCQLSVEEQSSKPHYQYKCHVYLLASGLSLTYCSIFNLQKPI